MAPAADGSASLLPWHVPESAWYESTLAHWTSNSMDESHDGVLGGWAEVDEEDARGSLAFLEVNLRERAAQHEWPIAGCRALDCGAGVGRVTSSVLLKVAEHVHLVEVSEKLLAQAATGLAAHEARVELQQASLREFAPPANAYDLVWAQWVLGHLTDTDVVALLVRCREALRPGGAVVVKDNATTPSMCDQGGDRYLLDEENAGVIRSHVHLKRLCAIAGLKVARSAVQETFPEDLHPVRLPERISNRHPPSRACGPGSTRVPCTPTENGGARATLVGRSACTG